MTAPRVGGLGLSLVFLVAALVVLLLAAFGAHPAFGDVERFTAFGLAVLTAGLVLERIGQ